MELLDPGCGPCSLAAAFVDETVARGESSSLHVHAFDIELGMNNFIERSLNVCKSYGRQSGIAINTTYLNTDYILHSTDPTNLSNNKQYTHCIMNPPYKKINSAGAHRKALRTVDIETVNLYSGFVSLALRQLVDGGELVAIIPRSFCNGPYYKHFRSSILSSSALQHIHIFDSRNSAFSNDEVLQENIIIHLIKGANQGSVKITSSPTADFHLDKCTNTITATDMTTRTVEFSSIVYANDENKFIHIAANNRDQIIINKLAVFTTSLAELNIEVSTGPVVSFRAKDELRQELVSGAVPLLYPQHLAMPLKWPIVSKPNAIMVSKKTEKNLWQSSGYYLLVKRFSSKEEKRRIVGTLFDNSLPEKLIGFENKLNVFHADKKGMDKTTAIGLYVYLNSSLLDKYYRLFGGHTQVNATDLRAIKYPSKKQLENIGANAMGTELTQKQIDILIERELANMNGPNDNNPMTSQNKIDEALSILKSLGMPKQQLNERSALTFLSLVNLHPNGSWQALESPLRGVTPIMDWCKDIYGKEYAANTRENFRRLTLHQFVDGGLALYNPDKPARPVNSPKACYQISKELLDVLSMFGTEQWEKSLKNWLSLRETLVASYAKERDMHMIPLILDDGTEIKLSPGVHSQLISDIITEFGPRFVPSSEVIYLGDTGAKEDFFKKDRLSELGVKVDRKGKLPDVVLYWAKKNWLILVESVTSHGPVDGKRHQELATLFASSIPELVYVTAFPSRQLMTKYLSVISWETEVWVSDAPSHMIHFNGDRFLGPH
ncbi:BsuBI/PstI family type II restriction endonuclease [Brumicola nitratireducens]|uniref:BsuBI/PstI family type II restriction endonuclease n=1 Tax=Brumicola nitratireducens TaxID=300231 RepID=UPI001930A298|nr:BsuBI/PstI family type II restriction endonuclease [Glaciecola nitratireducens]